VSPEKDDGEVEERKSQCRKMCNIIREESLIGVGGNGGRLTDNIENRTNQQDRYSSKVITNLGIRRLSSGSYDRSNDADC